jgi:alpha-L-fucosidase
MSMNRRMFLGAAAGAGGGVLLGGRGAWAEPPAFVPYEPTRESLSRHATPAWYREAKFGIFIHWGVYSVPAWGDKQWSSEWYLYGMNAATKGGLFAHHRDVFGPGFAYDDFIPLFTAENYDPDAWIRLFERAGARYFVLTSKHHDGFQLFPNDASDRHSVALGPRRDLAGDLFHAARHSHLRRGFYYSLGEFYSPALGTPPHNPFTGEPVPYTGFRPVTDYVTQYEQVHLRTLIDRYDPDLLWADGQGSHDFGAGHIFRPATWNWHSNDVVAYYYNRAGNRPNPREVVVNDRFEASHADFNTVEGDKTYTLRSTPWEAALTMSRSWGYMDPTFDVKSKERLLQLLVDVVAKNGNLLLNIGPKPDGTIAGWQAERLVAIGEWLDVNGAAIYGSTPWKRADDGDLRYTQGRNAFNIIALTWPGASVTVPADVPVPDGARIRLLGHTPARPLPWTRTDAGIEITLPPVSPYPTPGYPSVLAVT